MKITHLAFAPNEQHMLFGLMSFMYAQGQSLPDKGAAWVIIGRKMKDTSSEYSQDEMDILEMAVDATIAAGGRALDRIPLDNVAARVKAGLVKETYLAIKGKLENAKYEERIHQEPEDLRGDNERRDLPESNDLHQQGGSSTPPSSGDGSG